jgi:hypothetical protein
VVLAWILLLAGMISLFAPTDVHGRTCHQMPISGAFGGSTACNQAGRNTVVGALALMLVSAGALVFLRWWRRRQLAAPQHRAGTVGGTKGYPALTPDQGGLLITSGLIRSPIRIDAGAVDMATLAPLDFGDLLQVPAHWGIGAGSRLQRVRLSFLFRSPLHVGPFRRTGTAIAGLTPTERRHGADLDIFHVVVADPDAARALLAGVGIPLTDDPGPALRARFGTADALTLAGRAKLRQSLAWTGALYGLVVVAVAGLRLALVFSDDGRVKDNAMAWTAALLVAATVGALGAAHLPATDPATTGRVRWMFAAVAGAGLIGFVVAATKGRWLPGTLGMGALGLGLGACVGFKVRHPPRDTTSDWTRPATATIHDARDPRGERQLRSLRRTSAFLAAFVVAAILATALAPTGHRAATAARTISTSGPSIASPTASTIAAIHSMVTAVDPSAQPTPVDVSVHGGNPSSSTSVPTDAHEWSDRSDDFTVIVESFASSTSAARYHQVHTAADMDDYSGVTRLDPPVTGATSFTCECGNVYVMYVRGATRVMVQVNPPFRDPRGSADQLARQIDQALQSDRSHTTRGA